MSDFDWEENGNVLYVPYQGLHELARDVEQLIEKRLEACEVKAKKAFNKEAEAILHDTVSNLQTDLVWEDGEIAIRVQSEFGEASKTVRIVQLLHDLRYDFDDGEEAFQKALKSFSAFEVAANGSSKVETE